MVRPTQAPIFSTIYDGKERNAIQRTVKSQGTSGGVYVPRDWIGKEIICILLED